MKLFLSVLLMTCTNLASAQERAGVRDSSTSAAKGEDIRLAALSWLSGAWEQIDQMEVTEEWWSTPTENNMVGMGRITVGGSTAFVEFLQIVRTERGVAYIAQPNGGRRIEFPLIEHSRDLVTFENSSHDYPRRIIYRREGNDRIFVRLEGVERGIHKSEDLRYRRKKP